ncbi:hypothetical protein [Candidatus Villigracilis affinis]|uniref:hypothetical protein n=1 Tax=Candidatus Villigracilis affinis TaxID=3140682 RepID=UPI002A18F46D|nr:hypothetical protein [Anaerolineales bacterium]
MTPTTVMFRPLPTWAFLLGFPFPLTIAFAEYPPILVMSCRVSKHALRMAGSHGLSRPSFSARSICPTAYLDGHFIL